MKLNINATNFAASLTATNGDTIIDYKVADYSFALDINALVNDAGVVVKLIESVKQGLSESRAEAEAKAASKARVSRWLDDTMAASDARAAERRAKAA